MDTSQAICLTLHFIILEGLTLITWGISGNLYLEPWKSILSRRTKHFLAVLFRFWKGLFYLLKRSYTIIYQLLSTTTIVLPCLKNRRIIKRTTFVKKGRVVSAKLLHTSDYLVGCWWLAFRVLDSAELFSWPRALTWSGLACALSSTEENLAQSFEKGYI